MSLMKIHDDYKLDKIDLEDGDSENISFDQELEDKYANELEGLNKTEPPPKPAKDEIASIRECLHTYMYCGHRLRALDVSVRTRG